MVISSSTGGHCGKNPGSDQRERVWKWYSADSDSVNTPPGASLVYGSGVLPR